MDLPERVWRKRMKAAHTRCLKIKPEQKVWLNSVSLFTGCFPYRSWIRGIISD